MKKNVKVLALALGIIMSAGTLFSLTSFAATEEISKSQLEVKENSKDYEAVNKNVNVYVSNVGLMSMTRIANKFTIDNSVNDIVSYLKEIGRFNSETQTLNMKIKGNGNFIEVKSVECKYSSAKIFKEIFGDKHCYRVESFLNYNPSSKLLNYEDVLSTSEPLNISISIMPKTKFVIKPKLEVK